MKGNELEQWKLLESLGALFQSVHMRDLFVEDNERAQRYSIEIDGVFLDYSKQRFDADVLSTLLDFANARDLSAWIEKLISGETVNNTEGRPALHTACRSVFQEDWDHASEAKFDAESALKKVEAVVKKVRQKQWRGYSGKAITDVVNIGVGGSDLGPLMMVTALQSPHRDINVHFISSIDGVETSKLLSSLNQETTLFIYASKSFTTIDTLSNAQTAKSWMMRVCVDESQVMQHHFLGVSASPEKMSDWGIPKENQLQLWDWIGGRYSLWSAIGLPIAIALGMDAFKAMLAGGHQIDKHFTSAPLAQNIPVIMALLDVWNVNFLGLNGKAILPYDARLKHLPSYFEQLVMESNGKSVTRDGETVDYKTCPILWGEVGPNAQHAFYQLLHQGTQGVSCDFIAPITRQDYDEDRNTQIDQDLKYQHELALANCLAQSRVLMLGDAAIPEALKDSFDSQHKHYAGNQPSNTILINAVSPKTMGMLVAIYEHKTFVESVMWGINPFDQWGVELGKKIALETWGAIAQDTQQSDFDSSTNQLIQRVKQ